MYEYRDLRSRLIAKVNEHIVCNITCVLRKIGIYVWRANSMDLPIREKVDRLYLALLALVRWITQETIVTFGFYSLGRS
jgi:hypothetical protein